MIKKIYLNENLYTNDFEYGIGSIYLAGPRNNSGPSWRTYFIDYIENLELHTTLIIPETKQNLHNHVKDVNCSKNWKEDCLQFSTAIAFWIPSKQITKEDLTELSLFVNKDKTFFGYPEINSDLDKYIPDNRKCYCNNSLDKLINDVVKWIKG